MNDYFQVYVGFFVAVVSSSKMLIIMDCQAASGGSSATAFLCWHLSGHMQGIGEEDDNFHLISVQRA